MPMLLRLPVALAAVDVPSDLTVVEANVADQVGTSSSASQR